jgi:hypothetical protein
MPMNYRYRNKEAIGLMLIGLIFLLTNLWQQRGAGLDWIALAPPVLIILLAGYNMRYKSVRTDEKGLTVQRRFGGGLFFPWDKLLVSNRKKERRKAAGLVLERTDSEEPYFLLLRGLEGEEQLTAELRQILGSRYTVEG